MKLKTFFTYATVTILAMLLTVSSASAEILKKGNCGVDGSNIKFTFDSEGTLTLTGTGEMKNYGTLNATTPWNSYKDQIKKIVIEPGVTVITSGAFSDLANLTSVEIPDTVTTIDDHSFSSCTSLTSVTIPESVKTIGEAFRWCTALSEINLTDNIRNVDCFAFIQTAYSNDQSHWEDDVLYIGNIAMYCNTGKIGDVIIKEGTTVIARSAFKAQSKITSITLPKTIKSIGHYAFADCTGISKIDLYPHVYIGQSSFENCTGITKVEIPDYAYVDASAFSGCSNLAEISIADTIESIDAHSFLSTAYAQNEANRIDNLVYIDNVLLSGAWNDGVANIREGTVAIASRAFNNSSILKSVSIPDSVRFIGASAFARTGLTEVIIPDSVTTIESGAFEGNTALTSVTLSKNLEAIPSNAFDGCKVLTQITIPDSVQTIAKSAFNGCSAMTKVNFGSGVKTVDTDAFKACSKLTSVYIKDLKAWVETEFANDYANPSANSSRKLYLSNKLITDLVIPDGIKRIGRYTFPYNKNITSITIPDSVEEIGAYAFTGCSTCTTLNLGKGVKTVDHYAFYSNSKLETVNITDIVAFAAIDFESVYSNPIYYTHNLYINGSQISSSLKLPEGATKIGSYAFYMCYPLTSVTIPRSVTSIGEKAFYSNVYLKSVVYYGSQKSWEKETAGLTVIPTTANLQYVCTSTRRSGEKIIIAPAGVEVGHTVILALYNGDRLVETYTCKYNGEETLTYTPTASYTKARVFVWDSLENKEPQHKAEKVVG